MVPNYVLAAILAMSAAARPLRAVSPTNDFFASSGLPTASGTQTHALSRMPIWIGSGDLDSLVLSFNGWYCSNTGPVLVMPNDYTVVSCRLEKSGAASLADTAPVTMGGSRSFTIVSGTTDIQADAILPSALGLSKFTQGDQYFLRMELSVAAGARFPKCSVSYITGPGIGLYFDPATYVGSTVDSPGFGAISTGATNSAIWTQNQTPYMPIVLGTFISGDPATFFLTGDSLFAGQNDTNQKGFMAGGVQRSMWDANLTTNPRGCIRMAIPGTTAANTWSNGNTSLMSRFMKYTRVLIEEYGCNEYLTSPGSTVATTIAHSKLVWDQWTGLGNLASAIIKPLFTPRSSSTQTLTSLTSTGTACTAGYGTATAPTVGNQVLMAGNLPAAYNGTFTVTAVDTTAKTFNYTAASAPGAATTVGTWSDFWATTTNQSPLNAAWASGGNARASNDAINAQVGVGIGTVIPLNSVRASSVQTSEDFYRWLANGVSKSITDDNTHPLAAGWVLEAAEYRALYAALGL